MNMNNDSTNLFSLFFFPVRKKDCREIRLQSTTPWFLRMLLALILSVVLTTSFVTQGSANTGLNVAPAKMKIEEAIPQGKRVPLKDVVVKNSGDQEQTFTVESKGYLHGDVKQFKLKPNDSMTIKTWLEVPEDGAVGSHSDSLRIVADGGEVNKAAIEAVVIYEVKEGPFWVKITSASSNGSSVVATAGGFLVLLVGVGVVAFFVFKRRKEGYTPKIKTPKAPKQPLSPTKSNLLQDDSMYYTAPSIPYPPQPHYPVYQPVTPQVMYGPQPMAQEEESVQTPEVSTAPSVPSSPSSYLPVPTQEAPRGSLVERFYNQSK
ncbi:hypothetical protein ACFYKX_10425 [Cytobacillus sp. FJAT-54145]|uniref:Uncharacterized protein n=1 Tax=Cytobacillus spartinae TaxID=3299023 RepID=A0ABW6KBS7_9BACI